MTRWRSAARVEKTRGDLPHAGQRKGGRKVA